MNVNDRKEIMMRFHMNKFNETFRNMCKNSYDIDAFTHITHNDLDGVSCAVVSNLFNNRRYDTVYTSKMIPATYDVIKEALKNQLHHCITPMGSNNKDLYILITDFGSITVDKLYDLASELLYEYVSEFWYEFTRRTKNLKIHFVVVDHHQSIYYNMNSTSDESVQSSIEYKNTADQNSITFTLDHLYDGTTLVQGNNKWLSPTYKCEIDIMVDMYLSPKYSAAKTLYELVRENNSFNYTLFINDENGHGHIENVELNLDAAKEYFDLVSKYDTGNGGKFIFDRSSIEKSLDKIDWVNQILEDCSPQMILNSALYGLIDDAKSNPDDPDPDDDYKTTGMNNFVFMVSNILTDKFYPYIANNYRNKDSILYNMEDAEILDSFGYTYHVWKILSIYAVNHLIKMTDAYDKYASGMQHMHIDTKENSTIYFEGEYEKYGVKFPEGEYDVLYHVYEDVPDEGVSINVFAKELMLHYNTENMKHIDLCICIYMNSDHTIRKCSLTQNPIEGANCYEIAKLNGGGGHIGAAGFTVTNIQKK